MHRVGFVLLTSVMACAGAAQGAHRSAVSTASDIPVHRFQDGAPFANSSGYDTAETAIIRTTDAWQAAWRRVHGGMTPLPPVPAVDFSRNVVAIVAMGTQASGGHGVRIEAAQLTAGTVTVRATRTTPGARCGVTMALTQPVDVVRLGTTSANIVFDVATTAGAPCP